MSIKQINVKQAERWLEKLKTQNPQSYKNIVKFLRFYEKSEDEYDCYVKISHTLLAHTELTKEINNYMEEPNKFIINRPEEQKIKQFLAQVKRIRPEVFEQIIQLIHDLSRAKGQNPAEISKGLLPRLREIVRGDPELQRITEIAIDLSGEELISRKNLEHLKIPKPAATAIEEEKEALKQSQMKHVVEKEKKNSEAVIENYGRQPGGRFNRPMLVGPLTNPNEEKSLIRQIQKMVDQKLYNYIIKVIKIYYLNIITRSEAFELLSQVQVDELYMQCLKDILDTRETDRRKSSCFKPLGDLSFVGVERASPSYVAMPQYYPIQSSGKPDWIKAITNESWVSVPQGSQESENFSVRNKNSNEINLLKAEDQRYQFDVYMRKLQKTLSFLERLLDEKSTKSQKERQRLVNNIISLGTLQLIYRQTHRDQRQEIQWLFKVNEIQVCKVFRQRLSSQINELRNIKEIHANKNWSEVASKNFFKALDLKGFEFKKNQKEKMKATFFTSELQQRLKLLQNGGQIKSNISFEEKKDFFTILNSFECSSRTQKCNNRSLPQIQAFDMKDEKNRRLYPLTLISLEDLPTCQSLYSLLLFYIGSFQMGQIQKYKCKLFLERFFINFLGWKLPPREYLNENFDQEKFYSKINGSEELVNIKQWLSEEKQQTLLMIEEKEQEYNKEKEQKKNFGVLNDQVSNYSYLPCKNQAKSVLYGSEHLYTLSRFVYAAYQRLIKMREVAENLEKIELFKILFYACIKTKEGSKFQQNLNLLFGKHAYLFSTLYKLFDNLIKCLSNISNCPLMNYSLKAYNQESEDVYFVLLNRFCLNAGINNNKIIRLTYNKQSKAVYFNYIESYYKSDDTSKDMVKKRAEIAKGIEIYTNDNFDLGDKKRRKPNQVFENSEVEYIFQGSTIKMLNHRQNEDLLIFVGKKQAYSKLTIKRQLKRVHKYVNKVN